MPLTVQQPTSGTLQIQGAMVSIFLPDGVLVAQPTAGSLPIIGAVVMGKLVNGSFTQQIP